MFAVLITGSNKAMGRFEAYQCATNGGRRAYVTHQLPDPDIDEAAYHVAHDWVIAHGDAIAGFATEDEAREVALGIRWSNQTFEVKAGRHPTAYLTPPWESDPDDGDAMQNTGSLADFDRG